MSYDLHVYTREQTPLDIGRLTERMRSIGWEIRVLDGQFKIAKVIAAGSVPASGAVFGWDRKSPDAQQCDTLFAFDRAVDLDDLPEDLLSLDGCTLDYERAEEYADHWKPENWTPKEWQEFRKRVTPEQYTYLCEARAYYYLRTSAHANLFRFLFQCDLGWAVAMETGGLVEDPQDWRYYWAREATPDSHSPIERATEEYQTLYPESRWDGLRVELPDDDDDEVDVPRPDGVNNLIWLALLESGLSVFRLVLGLRFQHHFSTWFLLLALAFLAVALGLFRGWRWAWWTMLVGYVTLQGADILLSKGFGFLDVTQVILVGIAVICLSLRSVRQYFGM
ncbi:MAG: hypothetical protein ACYDCO_03430 [Armatimonadota bacterium]